MSSLTDTLFGSTNSSDYAVNYTKATASDLTSDIGNLLSAYKNTQGDVLSFEQQYRPQYTALNLSDIGQYGQGYSQLGGQLGLQGVSQVQQARMGELYGQGQLASGARGVMQALSPEQASLISQAQQRANTAYASSQGLNAQETRAAQQAAREGAAASGRLGGNAAIAQEVLNRESYLQSKRSEADTARQNAYNLASQFYTTPGMQLITQQPYGLQLGSSYLSSAQQSLGASTPQLFSSDTALNIGATERGNVLAASTATQANAANVAAAKTSATGQIISGIAEGAGTAAAGIAMASDRRVKKDIEKIGETKMGLPIYTFKYKDGNKTQMGVMAQDVEKKIPKAVSNRNGIKMVNYSLIK
jgi:hypothetical protein